MKSEKILFPLYLLVFLSTLNIGCFKAGTLGGSEEYVFDCSRGELQHCLDTIKVFYPKFYVPSKWEQYDNWKEKGYGFLSGVTFYFDGSDGMDERMYYVTLINQNLEDSVTTKPSYLAIRSIFMEVGDNKVRWKTFDDISKKEGEAAYKRIESLLDTFSYFCSCQRLKH